MPTLLLNEEEELLEAVKAGRESKVQKLLLSGCRPDVTDTDGKTAFHWACQYGHLGILCLLLSHVPSTRLLPTSTVSSHTEAEFKVCIACRHSQQLSGTHHDEQPDGSHQAGLRSFQECEQDVHSSGSKDKDSNSIHVADVDHIANVGTLVPSRDCARNDNVCTCSNRRQAASHVINTRDVKGQTPLLVACNYRRADVASFLVTLPYCDVNAADQAGNTALHRAIHNNMETVACLLCDAGGNVRAANAQLQTPLHEAIRSANHNVVRALLARGCDVNAVTRSMAAPTPFLTAVFYYKISVRSSDYATFLDTTLRLLIESGCRLSHGDYQWTPLSAAVDIDNSFIASLLLFNGCLFQKSGHGRSLLVEAFTHCEAHVTRLLVLCGYQPSLEEVQTCSRRIPAFSPLFYRISRSERAAMKSKSELLAWLRQRACGCPVPSLMELSRMYVRRALNHAASDTSILGRIPLLPIPGILRQYVALSDFTHNCQL